MAEKLPHIQLYPGDWLRDGVSGCSLGAQGLWLRMMFLAHDSARYGYLETNGLPMQSAFIARKCGCDDTTQYETLLSELVAAGVPSKTADGILFSRRMVRDAEKRATISFERVKAGRKGGNQTAKQKRSKRQASGQQTTDTDSNNDYSKKKKDDTPPLPPILDRDDFRETLTKWREYKGKPYKPAGLTSMISRAATLATEHGIAVVIAAFEKAMANDWKGWDQESSFTKSNGRGGARDNLAARKSYLERHGEDG